MTEPSADTNKKSKPVYFASIEVENVLCFKTRQKLNLCEALVSAQHQKTRPSAQQ